MTAPEEIRAVYETYWAEVSQAAEKQKPLAGAFGTGGGLGAAPCHEAFARELEDALRDLAPLVTSGQARRILDYIYRVPMEHQETPSVYWMLTAVHGLTLPLIQRLEPEDAAELWTQYKKIYPPWDRFEPQKKVLAALKNQQHQQR